MSAVTRTTTLVIFVVTVAPKSAAAQPLGPFRWQLQPYCNVITLSVTGVGPNYTLDGTDASVVRARRQVWWASRSRIRTGRRAWASRS